MCGDPREDDFDVFGDFLSDISDSDDVGVDAPGRVVIEGFGEGEAVSEDLDVKGFTPSTTNILRAGGWIQLGTGSSTKLHKVLDDVDSDGSGNATITITPKITVANSPADNDPIVVTDAKGIFRLKENLNPVDISPPNQHSIAFSAREAI